MNQIDLVRQLVAKRLPKATFSLDRPAKPHGSWWLDIRLAGHCATVEWRPGKGFGISASPDAAYGEGPHETYADAQAAGIRLTSLLREGKNTSPPEEAVLSLLRQSRRVSQQKLAEALKVTQATVSKMERRSDMYISTLSKTIAAMGGELEIRALFPDGSVRIVQFQDIASSATEEKSRRGNGHSPRTHVRDATSNRKRSR